MDGVTDRRNDKQTDVHKDIDISSIFKMNKTEVIHLKSILLDTVRDSTRLTNPMGADLHSLPDTQTAFPFVIPRGQHATMAARTWCWETVM